MLNITSRESLANKKLAQRQDRRQAPYLEVCVPCELGILPTRGNVEANIHTGGPIEGRKQQVTSSNKTTGQHHVLVTVPIHRRLGPRLPA